MNINVNIDRLILHGIPLKPRERRALHGAVERELGRLLAKRTDDLSGVSSQQVARISAERIQLPRQHNTQQLGRQIATAIYGGVGQ